MKLEQVLALQSRPARAAVGLAAALCCTLAGTAWAQPQPPRDNGVESQQQGAPVDPPGRVGRLADVTGQAWLFSPDTGEWVAATRNQPLTSGDRLATDPGARAEVRIGSTTLRLDANSELEVLRLDDDRVALRLHEGSLFARLRNREAANEFEIETGEGHFRVQRTGRYRFDRADDASHLTVYSGQARYDGQGSALTVYAGQRGEFWIDRGNAAQYSITEPSRDDFATWNGERDRADDRTVASRYVSPEMTGIEDLDRYGRWEESSDYGPLWIPRSVATGWAPYSSGHWAWVRPWGWTWVDDAPWGFAPFHYGRWVWLRNTWCWAPGTFVARPVYAPALVAWVGGPRLNLSVSIGGGGPAVGWFPLAPREVYVPSYRVSPGYTRNVNIGHAPAISSVTTYLGNTQTPVQEPDYRNRKFPHAITVVPSSVITNRQPVGVVAAQTRDLPGLRDFAYQPGRNIVSVTVPAGIEAPAPRAVDTRPALPPGRTERPWDRERDGWRPRPEPRVVAQPPAIVSVTPNPGLAAPPPQQRPAVMQPPAAAPQPVQAPRPAPPAAPAQPPRRDGPSVVQPRPETAPQPQAPQPAQPRWISPRVIGAPLPQAAPPRATPPAVEPPRVVPAPAPALRPVPPAAATPDPRQPAAQPESEQDLRKRRHREPSRGEGQAN